MKNTKLTLYLIFVFTISSLSFIYSQSNKDLIVLVKYKTLPGKDSMGIASLKSLVAIVKNEPNYVSIKILFDPIDKSNILLYEQWSNEDYYKGDHLQTPHILKFMNDSRSFLAGPPEITFWKISD
jgi:quinol monooxygenase YgiN